jgi:hypothetical protein
MTNHVEVETDPQYTRVNHQAQQAPRPTEFRPTDRQLRAKSRLLAAVQAGQVVQGALSLLDPAQLAKICKAPDIASTWQKEPGFLAWLTDDQEAPAKLNYLRAKAFTAAELILENPDPKVAGAQVALIKVLLGYEGPTPDVKPMNMEDLKKLVLDNRHILLPLLQEASTPPAGHAKLQASTPQKETT